VLSIVTLDTALEPAIRSALPVTDRFAATSVSPLALADTDGDGTLEILFATETSMHVLSATGAERPGWPYAFRLEPGLENEPQPGAGASSPLVVDLDGDGALEIALQLAGGAWLAWEGSGVRRRDLETALPAGSISSPLIADLDGAPGLEGLELAAIGRFASSIRYLAGPESLVVAPRTQIAVWNLRDAGSVVWGELGGGPGHAFLDARVRNVQPRPNDAGLASFVVGPNPAASEVRARVELTSPAEVRCRLYTIEGEIVREASRSGNAGTIVELVFDLRGLASGTYLAQLELSTGGSRVRPVAVRR